MPFVDPKAVRYQQDLKWLAALLNGYGRPSGPIVLRIAGKMGYEWSNTKGWQNTERK